MDELFTLSVETDMSTHATPLARIIAGLREQQSRVIANWAVRISTLPVFRATPELALGDLQSGVPALLDAALAAIEVSNSDLDDLPLEQARTIAATHGRQRFADGFE